jgi:hypothetical protein
MNGIARIGFLAQGGSDGNYYQRTEDMGGLTVQFFSQ